MTVAITPLDAPCGAEVSGFDPHDPPADDVAEVLQAFREHHVLVLRGQPMTDPELLDLASWFGPQYHPPQGIPVFGTEEQGTVAVLSNRDDRGIGSRIPLPAHTDFQYMPVPLLGAVLHAVEVPPTGGDTLWSNMHQALDELEDAVRDRLEGVKGVGLNPFAGSGAGRDFTGDGQLYVDHDVPEFPHPVIRTHPNTGRRSLYFSSFVTKLDGVDDPDEEKELIDHLWAHVDQDHLYYRHRWEAGDTIIWDNRCTNHKREDFDQTHPREMHRVQIAGTRPF